MPQQLKINASLVYDDGSVEADLSVEDFIATVSTEKIAKNIVSVGLTEGAIPLGEVATLGYVFLKNLDPTNFVEVRPASGSGNDYIRLDAAGGIALFRFGSDCTAPYWIANTGACKCVVLLINT